MIADQRTKHRKYSTLAPNKTTINSSTVKMSEEERNAYPWAVLANSLLLLFLLIANEWYFTSDIELYFAIGSAFIFIAVILRQSGRQLLFKRLTPIFVMLLAQCLLYFAGLFYAVYPKFALQQFFVNVGAFFVFSSTYVSLVRNERNIEIMSRLFTLMIAIASIVSIELATSRYMLGIFEFIAGVFKAQLPINYGGFETNTRIITVLGNPNVFAPIAVFGLFLSIWNHGKADIKRKSSIHLSLAIVCGTAFILCFSLGTVLTYMVMLAVFVVTTEKGDRGRQLFTHIYVIASAMVSACLIFALRDQGVLPLLAGLVVWMGTGIGLKLIEALKPPHISRLNKVLAAGLLSALCIAFFICAASIKTSYSLSQGSEFERAVKLKPGSYNVTMTFDDGQEHSSAAVTISSMSYEQAALKENSSLAIAQLQSGQTCQFNVNADTEVVFFKVAAENDLTISNIGISGTESKNLPLKYVLLPEFIVNRLQGLWVNDNAIQRFVFFRDGLRLGLKSPIIGLGGGSFEGGLYSVADYHYETKHTHSELIQRFDDGGIVAVLAFCVFIAAVIRALYRSRHLTSFKPYYPMFAACMTMVFLHSLIEVDFFMTPYRTAFSVILALLASQSDDVLHLKKYLKVSVIASVSVLSLAMICLSTGKLGADRLLNSSKTLQTLDLCLWLDPLNSEDYMLSYLINTKQSTDPDVISKQSLYLEKMRGRATGLDTKAQFYFLKTDPDFDGGIQSVESYIRENRVDQNAWNTQLALYNAVLNAMRGNSEICGKVNTSAIKLSVYLNELNYALPKKLMPELAPFTYVRAMTQEAAFNDGVFILDSRIPCDLDQNGQTDLVLTQSDNAVQWKFKAILPEVCMIQVFQHKGAVVEVSVNGEIQSCRYNDQFGFYESYVYAAPGELSDISIKTDSYNDSVYFAIQ